MIPLDPQTTTLVLIDRQGGILGKPLEPRSGLPRMARMATSRGIAIEAALAAGT